MKRFWLRLREFTAQFWFVPASMTLLMLLLAELGVRLEEDYGVPERLSFVYGGGETGARSLLAAIASSSIGVAGTVFSITIAALSYAAGSMGPRLLDNFTRDRGNQVTLGTFISTFAFSLYTLRYVQGSDQQAFVPHCNVTLSLLLALGCVGALVYYLAHITRSIDTTQIVNLLRNDLRQTLSETTDAPGTEQRDRTEQHDAPAPPETFWEHAEPFQAPASGYLQLVDTALLVRRAAEAGVALRLYVRPGDYVFLNSRIAAGVPHLPPGLMDALTLGDRRTTGQDVEYSVRQLTELAARALSPGVNDPVTAIDVIDRFGDALCSLQGRRWPSGVFWQDQQLRLVIPVTDFAGLTAGMFHMIRQYGKDSPAVMIRLLEVLEVAGSCLEQDMYRSVLRHHAALVHEDALAAIKNSSDRADIEERYRDAMKVLQTMEV